MPRIDVPLLILLLLSAAAPPDAFAWTFELELPQPGRLAGDLFGAGVALRGPLALVGAPSRDAGATNAGAAWLFEVRTGEAVAFIPNPAPGIGDTFGSAVALDGGLALIGAYLDDYDAQDSGSAWLFDAPSGTLLRVIPPPVPGAADSFGVSVALDGGLALIGAHRNDHGASNTGAAWIFDTATGEALRMIPNPEPQVADLFGWSSGMDGGVAVIGAYLDEWGAGDSGSVHVFEVATGVKISSLRNPTPSAGDWFGWSVGVSDGIVIVGAPHDDAGAANAGAAHLFDASTGALIRTLDNPEPGAGELFGISVSIRDGVALVGCYGDPDGAQTGAAYLFDAATGALLARLDNPFPSEGDRFGEAVSMGIERALVGALRDDKGAVNTGGAYLFAARRADPSPVPGCTPTPLPCHRGDANHSGGFIDALDFIAVQANFGAESDGTADGDADCSGGLIDAFDFIAVQAAFGGSAD